MRVSWAVDALRKYIIPDGGRSRHVSLWKTVIEESPSFSYPFRMNQRGILMIVLLALFCGGQAICQIEAGKSIQITIKGVPAEDKAKIDAHYPVNAEGMVNLPFIGKMKAAGETPEQLKAAIEKAYVDGGIYEAPEIQVLSEFVDIYVVKVIHLGGQVRTPGSIDFTDGMTLWKAIQAAGGATEFGSMKRVNVYRDGKQTTYDLTVMANRKIPLEKNDTVEVPSKSIGCR